MPKEIQTREDADVVYSALLKCELARSRLFNACSEIEKYAELIREHQRQIDIESKVLNDYEIYSIGALFDKIIKHD